MQKMKTTEPAMGPLFEPWLMQSGASLATPDDCLRRVESEYAFRMAASLPAREKHYTREDVADAVATVHPTLEVAHNMPECVLELVTCVLLCHSLPKFLSVSWTVKTTARTKR